MTILTVDQEMHLRNVLIADIAWRDAKRSVHARAKTIAESELAGHLATRDGLVRAAVDAGVPKVQIRELGLGTKNPRTLLESLARTARAA